MALRDRPYLPLYVQDFVTDEKLANCSAESTGVYIRLLCAMHKSKEYGKILLRQKYRQTPRQNVQQSDRQCSQQVYDFSVMLTRLMPYDVDTISRSLEELIDEEVIYIDGDTLCQKRMIKDAKTSENRAVSGKKGADTTNERFKKDEDFAAAFADGFADDFAAAKIAANSESENESEIESNNKSSKSLDSSKSNVSGNKRSKAKFVPPTLEEVEDYVTRNDLRVDAKRFYDYFDVGEWIDSKGNPVRNWKQKILMWDKQESQDSKSGRNSRNTVKTKYNGRSILDDD